MGKGKVVAVVNNLSAAVTYQFLLCVADAGEPSANAQYPFDTQPTTTPTTSDGCSVAGTNCYTVSMKKDAKGNWHAQESTLSGPNASSGNCS